MCKQEIKKSWLDVCRGGMGTMWWLCRCEYLRRSVWSLLSIITLSFFPGDCSQCLFCPLGERREGDWVGFWLRESEMSGVILQPGVHSNSPIWSGVGLQSIKDKIQPPENKNMVLLKSAFLMLVYSVSSFVSSFSEEVWLWTTGIVKGSGGTAASSKSKGRTGSRAADGAGQYLRAACSASCPVLAPQWSWFHCCSLRRWGAMIEIKRCFGWQGDPCCCCVSF